MPATIFSGTKVKTLKDTLQIGNGPDIIQGTVNPQSVATAGAPSSLYMNTSTGDVFRKLDSGTSTNWQLIGAGSGGGGLNFVGLDTSFKLTSASDVDAEVSVGNHIAYADAAAVTAVDMTGGSPGTTVTRSASSPLNGAASILMDLGSGSSRQGEGHSLVVNIPPGYRGLKLEYSFAFAVTGALAEDDLRLSVYDVTNGSLIQDLTHVNKVFGSSGIARVQFPVVTTTAQIRVGLHVARVSTGALSVKMDDFQVGPKLSTIGLAGSDPTAFIPTGSWNTNTTYSGFWTQVGKYAHYEISVETSGLPSSGALTVNLPSGQVIDTSVLPTGWSTAQAIAGSEVQIYDSSTGNRYPGAVRYSSTTSVAVQHYLSNTVVLTPEDTDPASPFTFASGDFIIIRFSVPIVGWSSNVTMASDPAALPTILQVTGNAASAAGGAPIIFPTVTYDTAGGYNASTGEYTVKVAGYYDLSGYIDSNANLTGVKIYKNGVAGATVLTTDATNGYGPLSGQVYANVGDVLTLRPNSAMDCTGTSTVAWSRVTGSTSIALEPSNSVLYRMSSATANNSFADGAVEIADFNIAVNAGTSSVTTGAAWKYTARKTGQVQVTGAMAWTSTGNLNGTVFYLYVNGSLYARMCRLPAANNIMGFSGAAYLNAGDYLDIRVEPDTSDSSTRTPETGDNFYNWVSINEV